jgi:hypothetical protein
VPGSKVLDSIPTTCICCSPIFGCFLSFQFALAYCRTASYLQPMACRGITPRRYRDGTFRADPCGVERVGHLEAIYIPSRSLIFHGYGLGTILGTGLGLLEVTAWLRPWDGGDGLVSRLKLTHSLDRHHFSKHGKVVASLHPLRRRLHVRFASYIALSLLEAQPYSRLLFLDWNLFHVEPDYRDPWHGASEKYHETNKWPHLRIWLSGDRSYYES